VTHIANNLEDAEDVLILQSGDDLHYATALHFQRTGVWPLFILFSDLLLSRSIIQAAQSISDFFRTTRWCCVDAVFIGIGFY
jgi:hypothetical protein